MLAKAFSHPPFTFICSPRFPSLMNTEIIPVSSGSTYRSSAINSRTNSTFYASNSNSRDTVKWKGPRRRITSFQIVFQVEISERRRFFSIVDRTIAEPINVEISESLRFPIPRFFESFTLSRFQKNFSKKTDSNDASFKKRSAARYQRSVISIPREAENVDKFAFTLPSKIDLVPNERKTRATNPPGYAQACPISPLVRNDMARPDEPLLSSPLPNPGKSPRV